MMLSGDAARGAPRLFPTGSNSTSATFLGSPFRHPGLDADADADGHKSAVGAPLRQAFLTYPVWFSAPIG